MSKELTTKKQGDLVENWKKNLEIAKQLLDTKLLPRNITTPQQVVLIIETGRELGIPPMEALRSIYVIDNKPSLAAQLMLSLIYNSGQLEDLKIDSKDAGCTVTMQRKGMSPHTLTFGEAEARAMGLNLRDNYKKQSGTMYRWRVISACARIVFPDIIGGMYTPEEIEAHSDAAETMGAIEQTAVLTDPKEYNKFFEDLLATCKANLEAMAEPNEISQWRKSYEKEMLQLTDSDRELIIAECEKRLNELVGSQETPEAEKSVSSIDEYYYLADNCKTEKELREWYKSIKAKLMKELSTEEFKELSDYCKTLAKKIQDKK